MIARATVVTACVALGVLVAQRSFALDADGSRLQATVEQVDTEWLDAMKSKDADRLAAAYASDALFILPDGRVIVGHQAIVEFYRTRVGRVVRVLAGGIHREGLTQEGHDLAFERGHGGLTTKDNAGHTTTSDGPYLTVWKRGVDGNWVIIRNLVF